MSSADKKNKKTNLVRAVFLSIRSFGLAGKSAFVIQNLAVLINAGMGVNDALVSVLGETRSWRLRSALREVMSEVDDGLPLSTALKNASVVSPYTLSLIKLGEESGRLAQNLSIASIHDEKERVFRSRIRSALAYSMFVVTVATVIGVGISLVILPQVASFFEQVDAPLPLLTQIIITFGVILRDYGFIIVPLFAMIVITLFYFLFSFPKTRFVGHSVLFHLPAIGRLIKETEVSRLGFIVGSMVSAGVPLKSIFELLPNTTTFGNYKKFYKYTDTQIVEGHTFKQIFASYKQTKKLIPLPVRQMIIAAEQSGTLSETFTTVGEIYESKVDVTSRSIPTFLEPILLLAVGVMVAVLALGILLPVYQLGLYI